TLSVVEATGRAAQIAKNLRVIMFDTSPHELDPEYAVFAGAVERCGISEALDLRSGVPMSAMPSILRECDVGLVAYGRELGVDSLPNRIFEYMAAGLPVIVPSYAREMASIVTSERCGLTVDFEDVREISDAKLFLWNEPDQCRAMGRRGREAFERRHNWEAEVLPVLDRIRSW